MLGISGTENDELKITSVAQESLYLKILKELKKFNMHLDIITNSGLTYEDAKSKKNQIGE